MKYQDAILNDSIWKGCRGLHVFTSRSYQFVGNMIIRLCMIFV